MTPHTVETVARRLLTMGATPTRVADSYRSNAATMRAYAVKASAARSGKHRGYTAAQALAHAAELEHRAAAVPAEMNRIASEEA